MKFLPSLITIYTIYTTLLLTAAPNQACEQNCRDGISLAFCNSYIQEWNPLFDNFTTNLLNNLYKDSNGNIDQVKNATNIAVLNQVNKLKVDFSRSCKDIVQNSIFLYEPKFKGQCQRPLKVIQPKNGVNWTLTDCQNQDYVCGNPPSICHFMDKYVKPRNVGILKEALSGRASVDGDFTGTITIAIEDAVTKSGAFGNDQSRMNTFLGIVTTNLRHELDHFAKDFNDGFCFKTSCDKYDDEIKSILLSFP
ncbi:hypothetical protein C1645_778046 [Glomus cerebriforme]|uniref:Lysine-specific metallo-endopeptidase domain-containing protein n=1 Tax=Glomus cerebriforme TaxID=658196 RepID=A0A397SQB3_9GLOM|nr:hypothetical protein C1645_778046 [Glomus cerebriforme]